MDEEEGGRYGVDVDNLDYRDVGVGSSDGVDGVAKLLEGSREREVERIRQQMQEILQAIERRDEVKEANLDDLQEEIRDVRERLRTLSAHVSGDEEDVEERRLRERLAGLRQEVREVRTGAWRNKKELRQELWVLERELEEVMDSEVVDEVLDGEANAGR